MSDQSTRRITVTASGYADCRLTGDGWKRDDRDGLTVTRGGDVIAEFAPHEWQAVLDEAHRAEDVGGMDDRLRCALYDIIRVSADEAVIALASKALEHQ